MNANGLKKAIDSLNITDVYMTATEAYCADDFDPKRYNPDNISYQFKHIVTGSQKALFKDVAPDGEAIFKVFIDVGCRFVPKDEVNGGNEDPSVLAKINSTMVAEYILSDANLDEDSLKVYYDPDTLSMELGKRMIECKGIRKSMKNLDDKKGRYVNEIASLRKQLGNLKIDIEKGVIEDEKINGFILSTGARFSRPHEP